MCEKHRNQMNKYSEDPEIIRNRKDKSILIITDRDFQPITKLVHHDVSFTPYRLCMVFFVLSCLHASHRRPLIRS